MKKLTKKFMLDELKKEISQNELWAARALLAVYEKQTEFEQNAECTTEANGVGFSGCDAEFLTSLAKQYKERGSLSFKQREMVKKIMPRYARQILRENEQSLRDYFERRLDS